MALTAVISFSIFRVVHQGYLVRNVVKQCTNFIENLNGKTFVGKASIVAIKG